MQTDPFLWLEEVDGERPLEQVRTWNQVTSERVTSDPQFEPARQRALDIFNDNRRIAFPSVVGDLVYNFWRDENNPRGIWRRTELQRYVSGDPHWEIVFNLDAYAESENANWVFAGASFLKTDYSRAMIALSEGGSDAAEYREFDLTTCQFIENGFSLPTAKSSLTWLDRDTLIVGTDEGPESLTAAGYPAILRRWRRGTPLQGAPVFARAEPGDMMIRVAELGDPRAPALGVIRPRGPNAMRFDHYHEDRFVPSPLREKDIVSGFIEGRVVGILGDPLDTKSGVLPEGAMAAYYLDAVLAGEDPQWELIQEAPGNGAIEGDLVTSSCIIVQTIEDVVTHLARLTPERDGTWQKASIEIPANVAAGIAGGAWEREDFFYFESGFVTPTRLHYVDRSGSDRVVAEEPVRMDAARYEVVQRFAVSRDGARIPYFLVSPSDRPGPYKVRISAYGGFRISQLPSAVGPSMQFWLEAGNAFVLANLRGGGEYGPAWHLSATRENRQRAFDDLHAVAEDLRNDGIASKVAFEGGSNGGLLAGVAYTQRPELYDAIVMSVPLADMHRYHLLLAGASWIDEYGNPERAEDWEFLKLYSPYHNLSADREYPPILLQTSTRDDRVHPGHARKFAALLEQQGLRFDYFENVEGGHGGAANAEQQAYISALLYTWLSKVM